MNHYPSCTARLPHSSGVFVALGSNLSHGSLVPTEILSAAVANMHDYELTVLARSSLWQSPAWPPGSDSPNYINAVCQIDTGNLSPQETLGRLHTIENSLGRVRNLKNRWLSRTVDLDLIAFHEIVAMQQDGLALPHPRAQDRDFVLAPLVEIAPQWRFPDSKVLARDALQALWAVADVAHCQRVVEPTGW
jgi:2-amino-4-hydroxy-6-hydroxymethyldihydropteridine diphosphokinase